MGLKLNSRNRRNVFIAFIILVFLLWILLISSFSPEEIVEKVGVSNGYIIVFIVSIIGGTSIFFPTPYYLFVITFAAGGLNPFALGILAGIGVIIGDSTSYFLAYTGREALPERYKKIFNKLCFWCNTNYPNRISLFLFVFGVMIPLPNDIVVIPLGLSHFSYKRTIIPLGLGNIIFNIIIASVSYYGFYSI